jgi:hypothetical protein
MVRRVTGSIPNSKVGFLEMGPKQKFEASGGSLYSGPSRSAQ